MSIASRRTRRRVAWSCLFAALLYAAPADRAAEACAFHLYAPEKTVVDWIIQADHLVVARNDPENPFSYMVTETLRDGGRTVTIDQLVDTNTRRRFASNPDDAMLFAHDSETGGWRSVAYLTPDFRQVVDRVRADMATWQPGYAAARFEMFAGLQDNPDAEVRRLAILEIDKAPYELLRGIDLRIPPDSLLAELWTPQGYPYQSIRILLLGLSGDDMARREIHAFVDRVAEWDWANNLGAFATALVEIDGPDGVARLEKAFLANPTQPLDKLEQVVEALAIHSGVGSVALRAEIGTTLDRFLRARPEAAPLVARQFGSRSDWSQAAVLQTLLQDNRLDSATGLMAVAVYVAQARDANAKARRPGNGG
jgi:hypothetical protein